MAGQRDPFTIFVQRLATGLTDFLGTKSTGGTPNKMAEEYLGVINVEDFMACPRFTTAFAVTGAITGKTLAFGPIVPAGELWRVHNITATAATPVTAGATISMALGIYRQQATAELFDRGNFLAGEDVTLGHWFERPAILMPGDRPCILGYAFTGAPNFTVNLRASYSPCLV